MKDEIIKRTLILTVTSLIIFFFLSLYLTSSNNRKNLEENLVSISNILNKEIEKTSTEQEMVTLVNQYTIDQNYLKVVITNSYGDFIIDSTNDSEVLNDKLTDKELKLVDEELSNKRIYSNNSEIFYITKINDDILVRTSIEIRSEMNFVLMSAFYMLIVIIAVIVVGILYTRKTSDMVVDAFHNISNNLSTINKGEYKRLDANHKFEEVNEAISEINKINESIFSYIQNISLERDKVNFIVDNMEQGLVIADTMGEILLINNGASLMFDAKANKLSDMFNDVTTKRILSIEDNNFFDYYLEKKDKIYELIISRINKAWKENDEKNLVFISIIDVTEDRKKDELKADFISSASHELKTPITSISGFSELLLDSYDNISKEKVIHYLDKIHKESIHMKQTIDELLYLSNLENPNNKTDLNETIYFDELVEEVYGEYLDKVNKAGLSLTYKVIPVQITGSSILIKHLITNLIDNAIKYNKEKGSINIALEDNDPFVVLKVSDTGIGIDEKDYEKIFDRFYRVEQSRNRKTGGTGFGLPICKKICIAHNTTISVSSEVGVGTTFSVPFKKVK